MCQLPVGPMTFLAGRAPLAYRVVTALRQGVSQVALRYGWSAAVLPYPGYGGQGRVRLLGRVLLAPSGTDLAARRGVPGWQRLLTLEQPDVDVDVGSTSTSPGAGPGCAATGPGCWTLRWTSRRRRAAPPRR